MQKPPIPANEESRIDELLDFLILDTPNEEAFDLITQLAASICDVPTSIITIVDRDRQWFKSAHHLNVTGSETPREVAFCSYTILSDNVMEVHDAKDDPRFSKNPLVLNKPNIRFYAGAPLTTANGYNLGSLCVISTVPKSLSDIQKSQLECLAKITVKMLDVRKTLSRKEEENWRMQEYEKIKDQVLTGMSHELITPLNAIFGFAQLLETSLDQNTQAEQVECVEHILERSQFLLQIIINMLELSGTTDEKIQFNPEIINLESEIQLAIAEMDRIINARKIKISTIFSADLDQITTDQYWLRRIIKSCLLIVCEFCKPYSNIAIQAKSTPNGDFILEFEIHANPIHLDNFLNLSTQDKSGSLLKEAQFSNVDLTLKFIRRLILSQRGEVNFRKKGDDIYILAITLNAA